MATNTQEAEPDLRKEGKKNRSCPSLRPPTQNRSFDVAISSCFADLCLGGAGSTQIVADSQNNQHTQSSPAVRFKSTIEEIAPNDAPPTTLPLADAGSLGEPGQVTPEQIRDLTNRLRACPLQERRMNIFSYEPVSLPVSRVRTFSHERPYRAFRWR
jgi:hypothetical protein